MSNKQKVNYGIDAPRVIRNLLICGVIFLVLPFFVPLIEIGRAKIDQLGLQTKLSTANFSTTFPPLRILVIKKAWL